MVGIVEKASVCGYLQDVTGGLYILRCTGEWPSRQEGGGAGQELGPPQKPEIDGRAHVSGSWKPSNVDVQSIAHTVTRSLTRQHDKDHLDLCRLRAIIHGRVRAPLDQDWLGKRIKPGKVYGELYAILYFIRKRSQGVKFTSH